MHVCILISYIKKSKCTKSLISTLLIQLNMPIFYLTPHHWASGEGKIRFAIQQKWGTPNSTNDLADIFHKLLECEMIFISNVELIHLLMIQPKSVRRVNTRCWFAHALPRSIILLSAYRGIDGRQRNQVNLALERKSFKNPQTVSLFAVNTDVFHTPRLQLNMALQKAWLGVLAYFQ